MKSIFSIQYLECQLRPLVLASLDLLLHLFLHMALVRHLFQAHQGNPCHRIQYLLVDLSVKRKKLQYGFPEFWIGKFLFIPLFPSRPCLPCGPMSPTKPFMPKLARNMLIFEKSMKNLKIIVWKYLLDQGSLYGRMGLANLCHRTLQYHRYHLIAILLPFESD